MSDEQSLVLAMPRRELRRISGFSRSIELSVLNSVAEDSWFASQEVLRDDQEAKEVRLGLVAVRQSDTGAQALVSDQGVLLHVTPIPVEIGHLGPGLSAMRNLALAAGSDLVGGSTCRVELFGYCNEESLPECRAVFILVYLLRVPASGNGPQDMSWISIRQLTGVPLDPVSVLITDHLRA